jgi:hypothetical protein
MRITTQKLKNNAGLCYLFTCAMGHLLTVQGMTGSTDTRDYNEGKKIKLLNKIV